MYRRVLILVAVASSAFAWSAGAADVTGVLLYDGEPIMSIFPDITEVQIEANPWETGDHLEGVFDPATSSYSISGLEAVRYGISAWIERTPPANDVGNAGDLQGYANVEPSDPGETIEQDLEALYQYHVVSPIDSDDDLDGAGHDCTAHPAVSYPITFTIEPVPRATSYTITVLQKICPGGTVDSVTFTSPDPTADVVWGTAGEDFHQLYVTCESATGHSLCAGPTFHYTDGHIWTFVLRNTSGAGRSIHRSDAVVIPAVAGIAGAHGTYWSSAVGVANLGTADREIAVTYTPRDSNGLVDYDTTSVTVPASSQVSWSDVLGELFTATGAGALELRGQDLAVVSRTSTPADGSGSYGQGIPPIQPEDVISLGGTDEAFMGGLVEDDAFRTNLGLCEIWGESVTVRVTVYDGDMTELGHRDVTLRPYENTQINQVANAVGGTTSLSEGIAGVEVLSGSGRLGAYLSVVDNNTGDPTFIVIAPQAPAGS